MPAFSSTSSVAPSSSSRHYYSTKTKMGFMSSVFSVARSRVPILISLLVLQSCSSFILRHFEETLERHVQITFYLTMLVGAGGNAGNQASVRGTFQISTYLYLYII